MSSRFTGSGRAQQGGFLATHKHDFNVHQTGVDYRHGAPDINMEPIIAGLGGGTVQEAMELLTILAQSQGTGFISVGKIDGYDGYDGYAMGNYNVGAPATPTFADALEAAFADTRLQNGGVVLLLAGTYQLRRQVTVTPGITIMGELGGSIISGEIQEQSMFIIPQGVLNLRIGGDSGAGTLKLEAGDPLDCVKFLDLILVDNLDGYIKSGGQPISAMTTVPMVSCEKSSFFIAENCRFVGRLDNGAIVGRTKTLQAVGGYTAGGGTATTLELRKCYIDAVKVGFAFVPGNGDIDRLVLDKCRIRAFGDESLAVLADNAIGQFSMCNATITNNHLIGSLDAGGTIHSGFVVTAAGTGNPKIVITGNTGGPSTNSDAIGKLFNPSLVISSAVRVVLSGNNWGGDTQSPWYVTVGSGAPGIGLLGKNEDDRVGDFNGAGAIDLLLNSSYKHPTTIIVFPGTYTVTADGNSEYSFIGQKINDLTPIFDMNLGAGAPTDVMSQRTFVISKTAHNIRFRSRIAVTSNFHSIRPSQDNTGYDDVYDIHGCIFENCSLSFDVHTSDTDLVKDGFLDIKNCQFIQDNAYSDTVSFVGPRVERLKLEGCTFSGYGYAGLMGESSGIYLHSTLVDPTYIIKDCVFDQTGSTIDDASTFGNSYLIIDDTDATVYIENTKQFVSSGLTVRATVINAGLSSYFRHVFIRAKRIYVKDSIFQGPAQTFVISVTAFPTPVVEFQTTESLHIRDSRFMHSITKVGGSLASFNSTTTEAVVIDGNEFTSTSTVFESQTLLDIDLDPTAGAKQGQSDPQVIVSNNNFHNANIGTADSDVPLHTSITGTSYNASGIVQIYARDFEIHVDNNKIVGPTRDFVVPGNIAHSAGLVVNNFDDTAGADSTFVVPISITNNHIKVRNEYATATSSDSAVALFVKGTDINVTNNHLQMNNRATPVTSMIGILTIDNRDTSAGNAPAPAVVTGNIFSNRDDNGLLTALRTAWLRNDAATEGDGWITDNAFSDPTDVSAPLAAFVNVAGGTTSWVVDRNKNQTVDILIGAGVGSLGLNLSADVNSMVVPPGDGTNTISSFIEWGDVNAGLNQILFNYADNSPQAAVVFRWIIPLEEVLPRGVYIVDIVAVVDVSANHTAGSSVSVMTLRAPVAGADTDSISPLTTAGFTHQLTEDSAPGAADGDYAYNAQRIISSSGTAPALEFEWTFSSTATSIWDVNHVSLTYRY